MDSLLPRIWAVEAVGMGATSRLLRTPYLGRELRSYIYLTGDWWFSVSAVFISKPHTGLNIAHIM